MTKKDMFSFWSPVIGAVKNKRPLAYFMIGFSIIQILISLFISISNKNPLYLFLVALLYLIYFLLSIMFLGARSIYVNRLIKQKKYITLKDKDLKFKDMLFRGVGAFIVSFIWNVLVIAISGVTVLLLVMLAFIFKFLIANFALLTIGKVLFVLILLIFLFIMFGGYLYVHFLINAYYSQNFSISDGLKFKEIIRKSLNKKYLSVVLKSLLMGLIFIIVLSPVLIGYGVIEINSYKNDMFVSLNPSTFQDNILNIFLLYLFIILTQIINVFSSFVFSYYSFEGYEKTRNKDSRR